MHQLITTIITVAAVGFGMSSEAAVADQCEPYWESETGDLGVLNGTVRTLAVFDDGTGPALYAGGEFTHAGALEVNHIARWDGHRWHSLGSGVKSGFFSTSVHALRVFDDGSGPALYVGGDFNQAGGQPASGVAKWDGEAWSSMGSFFEDATVNDFEVFDAGDGPRLFAAGARSPSNPAVPFASWDGSVWVSAWPGGSGRIRAMHVADLGFGPEMIVAGGFSQVGEIKATNIARWDGQHWATLHTGLSGDLFCLGTVSAPDGTTRLYAGGRSLSAGGAELRGLAVWTGSDWAAVENGQDPPARWTQVRSITDFDDGTGTSLYATGDILLQDGTGPIQGIAKWNGDSWLPLGAGGLNRFSLGYTLLPATSEHGPALLVGGNFFTVGTPFFPSEITPIPSPYIAIWQGCAAPECPGDVNSNGSTDLADLNLVLANFGQQTDSGDSNGDGVVDLADLNAVLGAFGTDCE